MKLAIAVLSTLLLCFTLLASDALTIGNPGGNCTVMDKGEYVLCHSDSWLIPQWTGEHLKKGSFGGGVGRSNKFYPDPGLPKGKRSELIDYRRSGYDRGHQAPASNHNNSKEAMQSTFVLSNMAPQTPELNRDIWRRLEDCIRALVDAHGEVYLFTGPIVGPAPPTIGPSHVAVPAYFFKAVLCRHANGDEMFGFVLPNLRTEMPESPDAHHTMVRAIENMTGLNFFSALPQDKQDELETTSKPLPPEALKWRPLAH